MEFCVGIIILIIVTVGGILIYGQFTGAAADRKRIAWAQSLNRTSLPALEYKLSELERQRKNLQSERLLLSGPKRINMDAELGECHLRIKMVETFIEECKSRQMRY